MVLDRLSRYLLPGAAESDPSFHQQIQRLSHRGLMVVGGVEIMVASFMLMARYLVAPDPGTMRIRTLQGLLSIALGVFTIGLSRIPAIRRFSRAIAYTSGILITAILIWFALLLTRFDPTADDFIPGQITLVMLVGVAAIPLRPTDTLIFGVLTEALYVVLSLVAQRHFGVFTVVDPIYVLFIFMLTLLATGLTAVVYDQRRSSHEAHQTTLRASEDLRQAEARNLLSQNAASVGRLAAALSHELNSPVGALVSAVDTLLLLAGRQATTSPGEHQRLVVLQAELRRSIRDSTERLRQIVARMQRFTNLDQAEVQSADINMLLEDVVALLESRAKANTKIELSLQPVPPLVCRPQQLSAVFSSLLGNALDALNGDGRVLIRTQKVDAAVEVAIEDNGRGVPPGELATIFDPAFRVSGGRVASANWSMFSSRQIVREHGGDINIESAPGRGTTVRVTLPFTEV